ncbi:MULTISPECIES: YcnI family protein [Arthrobacter]|uniref:YcnI family protein n=2 Tax=Arthrobacter TaxID=1663 RepID=A0ABU9KHS7_9MICC|nr:YcnI family protein [Arthrobacter sp. YJM1]MDP5226606.1 YcnI family protein [Arthrobacter sp. YJM1]
MSRILKSTLSVAGAGALLLVGAAAASAHVEVSPDVTSAKQYALLTFSVPHGCAGQPTTKMTITLPQELDDATPTVNPNWTISKVTEKLPAPKKLETGNSITERTKAIVYTAKTPLDPHQRDTMVLSVQVPDTAGKTLYFPTLQECTTGSTNWDQIPAPGADEESVKSPAPSFTVTQAVAASEHGAATPEAAAPASSTADSGDAARSWVGLGAGVAGLVLGGVALMRVRRSAG